MDFKCVVFGLKGEKRNSNERVITLYYKLTTLLQISHFWREVKIYLGRIFFFFPTPFSSPPFKTLNGLYWIEIL